MRKYLFALLVLVAVGSTLTVAAVAGSGSNKIDAKDGLEPYQEVPAVSSTATGTFEAEVANDETSFNWTLSYGGLEGSVTQAHIHFGQRHVNGGISIWLCGNPSATVTPPAGTQTCPASPTTISGTADASDVVGPAGQGIAAAEFNEILAAIRAGKAYANVHSSKFPGGEIRGQLNDPNER